MTTRFAFTPRTAAWRRTCAGFTLVELSVVLVIIAVILGAVTVGSDLLRNANGQRIFSEFVTAWSNAFSNYTSLTNSVPGDDPLQPTNIIKAPNGERLLCNSTGAMDLTNIFLAHAVTLPAGWTPGQEDRYLYQDSNGSPHELRVCFLTTLWSVPGTSAGQYVNMNRHVMQLTGLTTELAMQLDGLIDGKADQRFGQFRSVAESASLTAVGKDWPPAKLVSGEDNINEVKAYLALN